MKSKIGTLQLALTTIGALLVGATSLAQQMSQVIVEVPRVEKSTQTGPTGQRRETLSIVYKVDYSDLNLATHSGAVELQNRIKNSAAEAVSYTHLDVYKRQERSLSCLAPSRQRRCTCCGYNVGSNLIST